MATVTKTFTFTTTSEGFSSNPGTSVTMTSNTGSLVSSRAVKANSGADSSWTLATTWIGLGVPAGAIVSAVTSASMASQCTAFTSAGSGNTSGAATLVDGSTTVTLSSQRSITGTDGSPVTTNGVDSTGLKLAASNSITLTIPNHLQNTNTTGSTVTLSQDTLAMTITFDMPVFDGLNYNPPPPSPITRPSRRYSSTRHSIGLPYLEGRLVPALQPPQPPSRQLALARAAIMAGEPGIEAAFVYVAPPQPVVAVPEIQWPPPRPRQWRAAGIMRGSDGAEAPIVPFVPQGFPVQSPQPSVDFTRRHRYSPSRLPLGLPYLEGRLSPDQQPPQPPKPKPWRGAVLPKEDGIEAAFIAPAAPFVFRDFAQERQAIRWGRRPYYGPTRVSVGSVPPVAGATAQWAPTQTDVFRRIRPFYSPTRLSLFGPPAPVARQFFENPVQRLRSPSPHKGGMAMRINLTSFAEYTPIQWPAADMYRTGYRKIGFQAIVPEQPLVPFVGATFQWAPNQIEALPTRRHVYAPHPVTPDAPFVPPQNVPFQWAPNQIDIYRKTGIKFSFQPIVPEAPFAGPITVPRQWAVTHSQMERARRKVFGATPISPEAVFIAPFVVKQWAPNEIQVYPTRRKRFGSTPIVPEARFVPPVGVGFQWAPNEIQVPRWARRPRYSPFIRGVASPGTLGRTQWFENPPLMLRSPAPHKGGAAMRINLVSFAEYRYYGLDAWAVYKPRRHVDVLPPEFPTQPEFTPPGATLEWMDEYRPVLAPWPRQNRAGAIFPISQGNANPFVPPQPVPLNWGQDQIDANPLRTWFNRAAAILPANIDIAYQLTLFFPDGWEIQPPPPPFRPLRGPAAIFRGEDGHELPPQPLLVYGWPVQMPQPPARRPTRPAAIMRIEPGHNLPYTFQRSGWSVQPWQPRLWPSRRPAAIFRGDDGNENPFTFIVPPPLFFYSDSNTFRYRRHNLLWEPFWQPQGRRIHPPHPPHPPNGRWRAVPDQSATHLLNDITDLQPQIHEDGFTIFFNTPLDIPSDRDNVSLIFVKPDGSLLPQDPEVVFVGQDNIAGYLIEQRTYAMYTFGNDELDQSGTWSVYLVRVDLAEQISGIGQFIVLGTIV